MTCKAGTGTIVEELVGLVNSLTTLVGEIYQDFWQHRTGRLDKGEEESRRVEKELKELSAKVIVHGSSGGSGVEDAHSLIDLIKQLDNIRYGLDKIMAATRNKIKERVLFSDKAAEELTTLFKGLQELLKNLSDLIKTGNAVIRSYLEEQVEKYTRLCRNFATEHEERLIQGICLPKSSSIYLVILDSFSDAFWYLGQAMKSFK